MKTTNEIMQDAKDSLTGKWGIAVGTYLVIFCISAAIQVIAEKAPLASVGSILISGPLALGIAIFALSIVRKEETRFEQIFEGFHNFGNALVTYLLMLLFILLWTLLLIIPGIIAAISYAMTFYILAENPDLAPREVLQKSQDMMYGYKMKYAGILLRIFGLAILCIFTLGIGFLFLAPYVQVVNAQFYEEIKDKPIERV
ncbi:DUF975 family protein [Flavicella sediminum]|uniref:DUF975 family protein n=1 Tax=Flavicella sediminum TaxID=2585141 RepID=UPI001124838B|nr:DUF975 family protein [Flavicella sediminum]